jgi:AraC family transcriptional regulator of adaptative response / DNA-3-methyladenine glycosylase II
VIPGTALDRRTCRRARLARDARFDGRFFVAVKTTGVFCRPICPAVPPRESNVEYFPSAAAAVEAGFRACLRCRPECAPGTPAWAGAASTVARALRLIGDGALDTAGVDRLAARLGIGDRHLRRLFLEHLGATPVAVAQTGRLLSAKRLIDDTDLPLTTIALSAGFGSIRRFNAAFLDRYGRSPRDLRRLRRLPAAEASKGAACGAKPAASPGPGRCDLQLRYRPPLDWDALIAFLAARAIPGVEWVDQGAYHRSITMAGHAGRLEAKPGRAGELTLRINFPDAAHLLRIVSRARRLFDLDADPMLIREHLRRDPLLAPHLARHRGLRVPGAWDGFELGVRAILGQQVGVHGATTLAGRFARGFGRPLAEPWGGVTHAFPQASDIAEADVARIGIPRSRGAAIQAFAAAVASGALAFDGTLDPAVFRERLLALPGIGPWTAEYVALRALGDPDAFPAQDLGLLRATGLPSARALEARAEAWRPWRGYAAMCLWTG